MVIIISETFSELDLSSIALRSISFKAKEMMRDCTLFKEAADGTLFESLKEAVIDSLFEVIYGTKDFEELLQRCLESLNIKYEPVSQALLRNSKELSVYIKRGSHFDLNFTFWKEIFIFKLCSPILNSINFSAIYETILEGESSETLLNKFYNFASSDFFSKGVYFMNLAFYGICDFKCEKHNECGEVCLYRCLGETYKGSCSHRFAKRLWEEERMFKYQLKIANRLSSVLPGKFQHSVYLAFVRNKTEELHLFEENELNKIKFRIFVECLFNRGANTCLGHNERFVVCRVFDCFALNKRMFKPTSIPKASLDIGAEEEPLSDEKTKKIIEELIKERSHTSYLFSFPHFGLQADLPCVAVIESSEPLEVYKHSLIDEELYTPFNEEIQDRVLDRFKIE